MKQEDIKEYGSLEEKLDGEHFSMLRVIKRKLVTFPAEMSSETGLSEYNIKAHVYLLKEKNLVEPVIPNFHFPQWELLTRVAEMSNRGQGGFPAFCQKRWFKLTEEGRRIAEKVEV